MNERFHGFGRFLILLPVALYIPLRALVGEWEESHHAAVVCLCLALSGAITLAIAAVLDKKSGINIYSMHAWTKGLMESRHTFFYLPIRVVGLLAIVASLLIPTK